MQALARSLLATLLTLGLAATAEADPFPPLWNGGAGPAIHHSPVAWPNEPANAADCGVACGDWKPYSRFQNSLNDPRVQDPSNGGTAPQNYVNVSSSCIDKSFPSIYYSLHRGAAVDGSQDVLMFRWRVEQIANTYATGPSAGNFGSSHPWSSALWTVLFDLDGSGFRDLAAHLNGSSGSPAAPIDLLAGIWGNIPTQSIDYLNDPAIQLIGHNPTAFVDGGTNRLLNFQGQMSPLPTWPNGSAEKNWDYGTTRAREVSKNACTEYFIDYQIPIAMLDASSLGGPKITRSTPISMLFCTANSLNNPFQKDCALNKAWAADPNKPAPFGDYVSFDQEEPYAQPIISKVTATGPATCPGSYALEAKVQDTLHLQNGVIVPSVKAVDFYYWHDADGDGTANEPAGEWVRITPTATVKPGTVNSWVASWDATSLLKGKYLIGAQAVDDNARLDNDMTPTGVDNRTFSYLSGNAQSEIHIDGVWAPGQQALFPAHSPVQNPLASENWYGNPDVTGQQIALIGVAINACGVAPTISKTASPGQVATGEPVSFAITIDNLTAGALTLDRIDDLLPAGFTYQSTTSITNDGAALVPATSPAANASGTIDWTFAGASIAAGRSVVLTFVALAGPDAGSYNNSAAADTGFGTLTSAPVAIAVDAARLSLSKTPDRYSVTPDGVTQVIYTLRYANDSSVTLSNASISDALPAGTTFVSCSGGTSCSNAGGTVGWTLGTLAGGASGSVTLALTVDTGFASQSLTNTATLTATPPSGVPVGKTANSTIAVLVPSPAFTLEKSSPTVQVAPGGSITWTLAYSNYGSGAASGVVLSDDLPDGFSFVSCSVAGSTHFGACSQAAGIVTFNAASIAAGASGSVSITATAAGSPFPFANPATNQASITWNGNGTPVVASAVVGVTGQSCSAIYYLESGSLLSPTAPPVARVGSNIGLWTGQSAVFTSAVLTSPVELAGRILSLRVFVDSAASRQLTIQVDRVSGGVPTAIATFQQNMPNTPQVFTFSTAAFAGGTPPLAVGEQLRVTFTGNGNASQLIRLFYDGTQTFNAASTYTDSLTSVCSATSPAALAVAKRVDAANVTALPAALQYTIDFANPGGAAAVGAQIVDTLPANVTLTSVLLNGVAVAPTPTVVGQQFTVAVNSPGQASGQIVAGGSGTLVVNATATPAASGTLVNSASLSATDIPAVTDSAETLVGTPGASGGTPALSVSKVADQSLLGAGDSVSYTLTVVNTGTGAASNVVVSDDFPDTAFFSYAGCSTAVGSCSQVGGVLTWNVGALAVGSAASLTLQMTAATTGIPAGVTQLDNTAVAADPDYCTGVLPASCSSDPVTVTLTGAPRLTLSKQVAPLGIRAAGDTLGYTLTLANTGSSDATGVVVSDPIRPYTQFSGGLTASVAGVPSNGIARFDAVDNRVVFEVGTLAAGASATLAFNVVIDATLPAGNTAIDNVATASAGNAAQVTASVGSTVTAAPLVEIAKSGPTAAPYPAAVLTAAVSNGSTVFVDDASRLAAGDWLRIGGSFIQVQAVAGRTVTLTGPVTAASGAAVEAAVTYSLSYRNIGTADASAVSVTDTLPAGLVFVAAAPAPSAAPAVGASGVVQWTIGTLAVDTAGVVQVTALPTQAGSFANVGRISDSVYCSGGLPPASCSDTLVTAAGGLTVRKTTSTPLVQAGTQASYRIEVRNSKTSAATGVSVSDPLPAGFTFASMIGIEVNGTSVVAATSPSAGDAVPAWTGLSIPAQGLLTIEFIVDVAADTGTATYDNGVDVGSPDTSVTPFDPLGTPDEDVTVVGLDSGVVDGIIYFDANANGVFEPGIDTPLPGVTVRMTDGNGLLFVTVTDGNGYFRRIITPGEVQIAVEASDIPPGYTLTIGADGQLPGLVTVPSGGSASRNVGYAIAGAALAIVATDDGYGPVNGIAGNPNLGSVFGNDTLDGAALLAADVTASVVGALPAGVSFNLATGVVGVAAGTAAGTLTFDYRICQNANPANCDTATVTIVVAVPALAFDKSAVLGDSVQANGTADAGEVISYTLTATNSGGLTLGNVSISDPRLPLLACTPAQPATLAPAETLQCSGSYAVTQTDVDSGDAISNTATASATPPGSAVLVASDSALVPVSGAVPSIELVKTALLADSVAANGTADAGETIAYTLTATNTGSASLSAVTISDPRLPALACTPAQPAVLAPGASLVCTGSYPVSQTDVDASAAIVNTATASGTPPAGPPVTATASSSTPVTGGAAAITLLKQAQLNDSVLANGTADAGESVLYTLTATNSGALTLANVAIADSRLPALVCVPAQPATLAPGASVQCTGSYTVVQADVDSQLAIANTATASGTPPSGPAVTDDDSAFVPVTEGIPAIRLVKQAILSDGVNRNTTADAGETISYTLVATNIGGYTLTAVTIADPRLATLGCTPAQPATLAPGNSLQCSGTYLVTQADVDAQVPIVNTATVTGMPPSGPAVSASDSTSTPVTEAEAVPPSTPMIGVSKALTTISGSGPYQLQFTIVVRNYGPVALDQLQIVENLRQTFPLPAGVSVTSLTATGSVQVNPGFNGLTDTGLLLPAGSTLAIGAEATVQLRVQLSPNGLTGPFQNVVVASGRGPDSTVVSDDSVDGMNADPSGNGIPDESGPTPIALPLSLPPTQIPLAGGPGLGMLALLVALLAAGTLRRRSPG